MQFSQLLRSRRARRVIKRLQLERIEPRLPMASDLESLQMFASTGETAATSCLAEETSEVAADAVNARSASAPQASAEGESGLAAPAVAVVNRRGNLAGQDGVNASNSRRRRNDPPATVPAEFRTIDGTGNNASNPEWGSTDEQLLRMAAAEYGDGLSSLAGADRPNPRDISNALAAQDPEAGGNERQLSAFIYVWGQFLDHDLGLTSPQEGSGEYAGIAVPAGDEYFDPLGGGNAAIPLTRSLYDPLTGTSPLNPRQQINQITAWIDGSMIYGSDQATADSLRTFVGGRLATSDGDLLPVDADGNFLAGDVRVNENIELTAIQTLFVREHNRLADQLAAENPELSDEEIYQRARAFVGAEIQAITYNEFLPALLGQGALSRYQGYDPTVNPNLANEFSTAAFRLGHSLLNDDIEFFGNDGREVQESVQLRDAFFHPELLQDAGIDSLLKYVASSQSQELDNQVVDGLRNFLFGPPGAGGLDLATLNIQRGRDHGLADYNAVREAYGLDPVTSFAEITSDQQLQAALEAVYGNVDDLDLWVAGLAEDHVRGGSTGELFREIVADQFERLRDGDRFWYERMFSGRELAEIQRTRLADIIERNTEVTGLQDDVFFFRASVSGQVFGDTDRDGNQDRGERGLSGITVELLDDQGIVVSTVVTGRDGRYELDQFAETGDYAIRIITPPGQSATTGDLQELLISTGDTRLRGVNFGLSSSTLSGRAAVRSADVRPNALQPTGLASELASSAATPDLTFPSILVGNFADLDARQRVGRGRG